MKPNPTPLPNRISSVDAYRGFVMFLMMAEVLSLLGVAKTLRADPKVPEKTTLEVLAFHQTHAEWSGCSLHDLIQPSFSFLVGVALPFSLASRLGRGQHSGWMIAHAAWRALVLVALGVFLRSIGKPHTYFTFEDTLTQIGLGYLPLFLLGFAKPKWQWLALAAILAGYWAAFALYPAPGTDFDYAKYGVTAEWAQQHNFTGFAAHWNKNANLAWAFDRWFLNLFPPQNWFQYNSGGYATLSFIPTLGTMILGLIAGGWLKGGGTGWSKAAWLALAGAAFLAAGYTADYLGVCPSVKRIWTPSWTLFSGGWCFLFLAAFYTVMDVMEYQTWAFPLRVIGMNSIAAYCIADGHVVKEFIVSAFQTHFGSGLLNYWGEAYQPLAQGVVLLTVYWLILFWMYWRGIFLRI
jgi:heparan-alpha-glucosaminide N-acetyltransferase